MEITFKETITEKRVVEHKKEIEFPYYSKTDTECYEVIYAPNRLYSFSLYHDGDFSVRSYKTADVINNALIKNIQITKEQFDDAVFELKEAFENRLNKISPPPPAPSLMEQIKPLVEPKEVNPEAANQ